MELPDTAVTLKEFTAQIKSFITNECEKGDNHLTHKNCGGGIQIGFANLYYLAEDGSLNPGFDGHGIGPTRVPYCEKCDPPDGSKYTYAERVPILKES
ncbi:MAG: hypothetical protein Q8O83_02800 [bacterium]|nr:hypothetical protein [bacterium]